MSRVPRVRRRSLATLGVVAVLGLGIGWLQGRPARSSDTVASVSPVRAPAGRALVLETVGLFAPEPSSDACARFIIRSKTGSGDVARGAVAGRCLEVQAWQALRDGRPVEAITRFRESLVQAPGAPSTLKGLGLAALDAGHPDEALAPLDRAVRIEFDSEVRLLLAHLYDHRDEPARALAHLRAILEREPAHAAARRLLDKIAREQRAETGFERIVTPRFVVKSRGVRGEEARRTVVAALEAAAGRVGRALAFAPAERLTVVMYEQEEFQQVTGVHGWATGLFDGKIRLPLPAPLPPAAQLARLIMHEYAHAAIHQLSRGRAPRWLHEGLAQALEGTQADPLLRVPGSLTLAGVEALVSDADPVRARAGYDIALWVVQDLLDRGGTAGMRDLLVRLGAGDSIAQAAPRVYGLRMAEIESRWRRRLGG